MKSEIDRLIRDKLFSFSKLDTGKIRLEGLFGLFLLLVFGCRVKF
jgi:hypothetical protein